MSTLFQSTGYRIKGTWLEIRIWRVLCRNRAWFSPHKPEMGSFLVTLSCCLVSALFQQYMDLGLLPWCVCAPLVPAYTKCQQKALTHLFFTNIQVCVNFGWGLYTCTLPHNWSTMYWKMMTNPFCILKTSVKQFSFPALLSSTSFVSTCGYYRVGFCLTACLVWQPAFRGLLIALVSSMCPCKLRPQFLATNCYNSRKNSLWMYSCQKNNLTLVPCQSPPPEG